MADTVLNVPTHPDSAAATVPIRLADNGDGTYSLAVSGLLSGGGDTAGEPIGLLLVLTKAE